jgi:hypothetical protein
MVADPPKCRQPGATIAKIVNYIVNETKPLLSRFVFNYGKCILCLAEIVIIENYNY